MIENQFDVEGGKPGKLLSITERVPLPAEIAHLTKEEQEQMEKKLVRKIDIRLMPIVILMFWLNILDR